jgi:formate hydrogenlyase subunit 3/multisubunit Na+/H+ antiporter MnhD subunit
LILLVAPVVTLLPLLLCLALLGRRWRPAVITLAAWIPLSALLLLPFSGQQAYFPWLLLGTRLGVDHVSLPFLLLAAIAWTAAGWNARNHLEQPHRTRFFFFWLLAWTGNVTVFLALDAATFYTAFALMSLAAYPLVVHRGTEADYRAGRVYLVMVLIGEAMLIAGLIGVGREAGNVDLQAMDRVWHIDRESALIAYLLAAGFAIKIGVVPLHVWLPLAHPQSPVPASAVLSGVMLKAGLIGWLRFLPVGFAGFELMGNGIIAVGLFTTFYGAIVGLMQQRPKTVLAYSSVSQMGLMVMGCGLILLTPSQVDLLAGVVGLFALHHGLAKAALFLGVDELHHHPRTARWLLLLPAASLAGLPLTSGLLAKSALKNALPEALEWLDTLLMLSSFLTALILLRFFILVWPRNPSGNMTWPWLWIVLLLCGIAIPPAYAWWWLDAPLMKDYAPQYLWGAIWPVLLAILLAALMLHGKPRWRLPTIPEGDIIAILVVPQAASAKLASIHGPAVRFPLVRLRRRLKSLELQLTRTTVAACLWAALLAGMLVLMQWR